MGLPFHFELEIGHRLTGRTIEVMWRVKNPDSGELLFMIGGHPAFQVPEERPFTIIRWYLIKKEKKREIIRRSFTIWRPMTRDIRWRKRPAA